MAPGRAADYRGDGTDAASTPPTADGAGALAAATDDDNVDGDSNNDDDDDNNNQDVGVVPAYELNEQVEELRRVLSNEVCSPVLQPFQHELVGELTAVVEYQRSELERQRRGRGGGDGHNNDDRPPGALGERTATTPAATLAYQLQQQDLARMHYLLRAYYRTRLWKLQRYPQHYLDAATADADASEAPLLSAPEQQFAQRYLAHTERHLHAAFLDEVPEPLRKLDDVERDQAGHGAALHMVPRPNSDEYVLVRFRRDAQIEYSDDRVPASGSSDGSGGGGRNRGERPEHDGRAVTHKRYPRRGEIYCLRFRFVRAALHDGSAELV